ncbi:MAG: hypothetical protein IJX13_06440 [Clostridia bacterium]|nr:hypothetical protein [Clostridia bacterium]
MYTDLFGKIRYKVNLHMHTTLSDGNKTPAEALQIYREKGYDALALTDHWFFGEAGEDDGIAVLSGAEYDVGGNDGAGGVYHILGIGMRHAPSLSKETDAQGIIDAIHRAGGIAILAHPAWSLNTPEQLLRLEGIDATEIYNSVSGVHMSRRADSSLIVDMLAGKGVTYPLLATDDAHYYDGTDECVSWIMAEAEDNTKEALLRAIRKRKFYATQGPEIHLYREGDGYTVKCSPAREIVFFSNATWVPRAFEGEGITEAHYVPRPFERFLRAEVTDAEGKRAWSNIIVLE